MNHDTIINEFINAGALLKGHFILSSGLHSDTYLQCARVLMDTKRADRLCAALAQKIRNAMGENLPDAIVAPAMGGVIVGYEMGRQLGIPTMFCERVDGSFTLRRGFTLEEGQKVLLVEDVVTTGKSSLETVACIESYGAKVVAEASLVDRSNGTHALPFTLYALITLDVKTYAPDALPAHLQGTEAIKPGSRWLK
ncbi:MAG: orotate phosphoribosyltransferase [Alphaproteobacteria bacterium]|nr:MAG: orotate phosphoribosyltransferase [Alphaproteobacteria bacterium]